MELIKVIDNTVLSNFGKSVVGNTTSLGLNAIIAEGTRVYIAPSVYYEAVHKNTLYPGHTQVDNWLSANRSRILNASELDFVDANTSLFANAAKNRGEIDTLAWMRNNANTYNISAVVDDKWWFASVVKSELKAR